MNRIIVPPRTFARPVLENAESVIHRRPENGETLPEGEDASYNARTAAKLVDGLFT